MKIITRLLVTKKVSYIWVWSFHKFYLKSYCTNYQFKRPFFKHLIQLLRFVEFLVLVLACKRDNETVCYVVWVLMYSSCSTKHLRLQLNVQVPVLTKVSLICLEAYNNITTLSHSVLSHPRKTRALYLENTPFYAFDAHSVLSFTVIFL